MRTYLSFETAVADIDARLDELRAVAEKGDSPALAEEIARLEARADKALADLYASLTPWQKTQVARHPDRPHCVDYIAGLIDDFVEAEGRPQVRRRPGDRGRPRPIPRDLPVVVLGQREGASTPRPASSTTSAGRQAGRLPQGRAPHGSRRPVRVAGGQASSTQRAPIPAWAPRSAARPRPWPARWSGA